MGKNLYINVVDCLHGRGCCLTGTAQPPQRPPWSVWARDVMTPVGSARRCTGPGAPHGSPHPIGWEAWVPPCEDDASAAPAGVASAPLHRCCQAGQVDHAVHLRRAIQQQSWMRGPGVPTTHTGLGPAAAWGGGGGVKLGCLARARAPACKPGHVLGALARLPLLGALARLLQHAFARQGRTGGGAGSWPLHQQELEGGQPIMDGVWVLGGGGGCIPLASASWVLRAVGDSGQAPRSLVWAPEVCRAMAQLRALESLSKQQQLREASTRNVGIPAPGLHSRLLGSGCSSRACHCWASRRPACTCSR